MASYHFPRTVAYHLRYREGGKGFRIRISSAWAHSDSKGFNIQLETMSLEGSITLRVVSEKKE
jgi:hypothetical protein